MHWFHRYNQWFAWLKSVGIPISYWNSLKTSASVSDFARQSKNACIKRFNRVLNLVFLSWYFSYFDYGQSIYFMHISSFSVRSVSIISIYSSSLVSMRFVFFASVSVWIWMIKRNVQWAIDVFINVHSNKPPIKYRSIQKSTLRYDWERYENAIEQHSLVIVGHQLLTSNR